MTNSDRVSDAPQQNWVDTYAPLSWRPYLRLSRVDRPIGTWLLLLPCLWGLALALLNGRSFNGSIFESVTWIMCVCGVGALLMRGAGCTWNDFTDRDIDAAITRTRSRPLPSGQVSPKAALLWLAIQLAISALLLFTLNSLAIALGVLSLVPVAIYPFAKRFTWWPQVFLGVAFNWGILLAFAAWSGTVHIASCIAYISTVFWTLFYDTIYAHQDREDDALIGVKSTARLFGASTKPWLACFGSASVVMLALAVALLTEGLQTFAAMLGVLAFGVHLMWQWFKLDIDSPEQCLILFRSNRDAGLLPLPFFALAILL